MHARRTITAALAALATAAATLLAPPAQAKDIGLYLDGDRPVVYGTRLVLDYCTNKGPQSGLTFYLWAKESGTWKKVAKGKNRKSERCASKDSPYLVTYAWSIDVLGTKASPLRYDLELGSGVSPSKAAKFVVPEYRSEAALKAHYVCLLVNMGDPVATDAEC